MIAVLLYFLKASTLQLVGGKTDSEGTVTCSDGGVTRALCDGGFDKSEADAICRSLGFR